MHKGIRTVEQGLRQFTMILVLMQASSLVQAEPSNFPRPDFPVPDGTVFSLLVTNGVIYIGGDFQTIGNRVRPYLAAVDVQRGNVLDWNPDAQGPVSAMALSGNTLYVGIRFNNIQVTNAVNAFDVTTAQRPAAWAGYVRTISIEGLITRVNAVTIEQGRVYLAACRT